MGEKSTIKLAHKTAPKTDVKSNLAIYQCKAIFEGTPERFELTMNKNDTVKVLDRQDHGKSADQLGIMSSVNNHGLGFKRLLTRSQDGGMLKIGTASLGGSPPPISSHS